MERVAEGNKRIQLYSLYFQCLLLWVKPFGPLKKRSYWLKQAGQEGQRPLNLTLYETI